MRFISWKTMGKTYYQTTSSRRCLFTITTELPVPGTVPVPPVECGGMLELQSPSLLTDWNILWRVRLYFCNYLLPNYVNSRWRKNFRKTFYYIFILSYFPIDHLITRLWVTSSWDKKNFTSRTKRGSSINRLSFVPKKGHSTWAS